jgi:hypothetical protein
MTTFQHITDEEAEASSYQDNESMDFSHFCGMQNHHECNEEPVDVATAYFSACEGLHSLCLVFFGNATTWRPSRDPGGSVEYVYESSPYGDETPSGADPHTWDQYRMDHYKRSLLTRDHNNFPKLVNFPGEVLHWQEWRDPPNFGFIAKEIEKKIRNALPNPSLQIANDIGDGEAEVLRVGD